VGGLGGRWCGRNRGWGESWVCVCACARAVHACAQEHVCMGAWACMYKPACVCQGCACVCMGARVHGSMGTCVQICMRVPGLCMRVPGLGTCAHRSVGECLCVCTGGRVCAHGTVC